MIAKGAPFFSPLFVFRHLITMFAIARVPCVNLQSDWDIGFARDFENSTFFVNSFAADGTAEFANIAHHQSLQLQCDNTAFGVAFAPRRCALGLTITCAKTGAVSRIACVAPTRRRSHLHATSSAAAGSSERRLAALAASSVPFVHEQSDTTSAAMAVTATSRHGDMCVFSLDTVPPATTTAGTGADEAKCDSIDARTSTGDGVLQRLGGHTGGCHACAFFPSGALILSGGADMKMRIWTVAEGALAAEFCGHAGGLTSVTPVGRGQSVLSASRDASVKLWASGTQQCISTFVQPESANLPALLRAACNECIVVPDMAAADSFILAAVYENGSTLAWDTRCGGAPVFLHRRADSIAANCLVALAASTAAPTYAVGYQDGSICVFDSRNFDQPVHAFRRASQSAIQRLAASCATASTSFVSSSHDGSTTQWSLGGDVLTEYTGSDCEPCNGLACTDEWLVTASDDGVVRQFEF